METGNWKASAGLGGFGLARRRRDHHGEAFPSDFEGLTNSGRIQEAKADEHAPRFDDISMGSTRQLRSWAEGCRTSGWATYKS